LSGAKSRKAGIQNGAAAALQGLKNSKFKVQKSAAAAVKEAQTCLSGLKSS